MTVEAITIRTRPPFRPELERKASQVERVSSLALSGQTGLSFLLLGIPNPENPNRIQKALEFLAAIESDLDRGEELII